MKTWDLNWAQSEAWVIQDLFGARKDHDAQVGSWAIGWWNTKDVQVRTLRTSTKLTITTITTRRKKWPMTHDPKFVCCHVPHFWHSPHATNICPTAGNSLRDAPSDRAESLAKPLYQAPWIWNTRELNELIILHKVMPTQEISKNHTWKLLT